MDRFIDLTLLGSLGVVIPVVIIVAVISYICWRQRRNRKHGQPNSDSHNEGAGIRVENGAAGSDSLEEAGTTFTVSLSVE